MEPFRIGDGLYYVGTVGLASYLLTSEEGHVLIDAPLEENVPRVLDGIRRLGFDPRDVRILLASHAHFDHVGGMAAMRRAAGRRPSRIRRSHALPAVSGGVVHTCRAGAPITGTR